MELNDYRDEAETFLKRIDNLGKNSDQKICWLQKEFDLLKTALKNSDTKTISHQIYDMLYLLFEIAADHHCDLNREWNAGTKKKEEKYFKN